MPISKVRYNIRRVKRKWDVQWFVSPKDEGEDGDKWSISSIEKDLVFAKLCEGMYEGYIRSIIQFRPSSLPSGSFVPTAHEAVCVLLILYVDLPCPLRHVNVATCTW